MPIMDLHNNTEKEDKMSTTTVKINGETFTLIGGDAAAITVMRALVQSDEIVTLTVESIKD